jgi:Fur family transcriptional regulator, zinc uptake regulator
MSHACDHTHDSDTSLTSAERADLLVAAHAACEAVGQRMTPPRQRTYEMILEAGAPVKAYDLIDRFHTDSAAKPPTVYRALTFLEQAGLIHRIESLNAYVACDTRDHAHTAAFLLCDCCGKSVEVAISPLAEIEAASEKAGFHVRRITLEARGLCDVCQAGAT